MDHKHIANETAQEALLREAKIIEKKKWDHYRQYQQADRELQQLRRQIYQLCEHDWKKDDTSIYDEHTKWICSKCREYR